MLNKRKILSIIPARSGSKGLPNKNIINLINKPLIAWTIEASISSKFITNTIVTSDSDEILSISKDYGANTLKRPKILSDDNSSAESVVNHVLKDLKKEKDHYDYLIYLQPTSPLRDKFEIDNAINLFFEKEVDLIISVYEIDRKYLKLFLENEEGYIQGIPENNFHSKNRQTLPKVYMPNGAIYIIKTDSFISNNGFISNNTLPYVMSKSISIDIDNIKDLKKAENKLIFLNGK